MSDFFAPQADFLDATLNLAEGGYSHLELPSGRLKSLGVGFLEFTAHQAAPLRLVLSAGVHGNETAPIEILNRIVSEIVSGDIQPQVDCLIILGNPEAMRIADRFVEVNLNRLFKEATESTGTDVESRRAREIMAITRAFLADSPKSIHYDLHTAIRSSFFEKFAVYPYLPARTCPQQQLELMGLCDIEAILLQNKPSSTFSGWTSANFGSESFTVELGKVAPFGQNDLSRLNGLYEVLRSLIQGESRQQPPGKLPQQFQVVDEIVNQGTGFELCIDEDTPNFTELPSGYEVWKNSEGNYVVGEESLYIVFPNSKVGPGQRAGLLVKPMAGMVLA